ncbi:MAG: aryl-sulfate sulfotransferase [Lewinellaceae bacterium]|nr:aryl-sulfate sulfotransferase [Phaeodactylibacter sp.]MCB9040039.1 aryl-sulfate sulfotransferase [Lewinellaceae bacterium]
MIYKSLLPALLAALFTFHIHAQTLGVIQYEEGALEGYTFFSPFSGTKAYLIDNCGRLVNQWDRSAPPGLSAYFLDNGLMLRTYKPAPEGPFTSASNSGGLELVDWDNNTVWAYEFNTSTWISHHDAVYMPNGHLLVLTWDLVYTEELVELGRDPNEIAPQGFMWSERIIEVEPVGANDINIVWQWEIKDHYIQDFDPTKLNYGVVSEYPERFDINLPELNSSNSNSTRDWNHFNSIDYHPELDQILISTRNSDEIWILDHSTTIEEAASHSGGRYGKGGDILYRWGNASAYGRAPVSEQKLFGQHGVHWIREGLPGAGKILIYNNGNGRPGPDFSTVEILVPPQDSLGFYTIPEESPIGPDLPEWVYGDQPGETFYSAYLSNAQRLPNGNTLINAGSPGMIFEIDPERNVVWKYFIPLFGDSPATQGGSVNNNGNFRAYKFGADYPGFEGKDLTAGSTIELGENPLGCPLAVGVDEPAKKQLEIEMTYLPASRSVRVHNPGRFVLTLSLVDATGRRQFVGQTDGEETSLAIPDIGQGLYFVQAMDDKGKRTSKKIWVTE